VANIRQSILIRGDLDLPMGLMAAQVAHLHMEGIRILIRNLKTKKQKLDFSLMGEMGYDLDSWLESPYLFVHKVPCLEVLDFFHGEFHRVGVPVYEWKDTITIDISPTQKKAFSGMKIGIAVGPCDSDKIKSIISDLPLL